MYKITRGDTVLVRSGKSRGKKGKVQQVFINESLVVVEGVNKVVRHLKARKRGESGQKLEVFGPVSLANVVLVCPSCSKPSRVGFGWQGTGDNKTKVRVCKACKKPITLAKTDKTKEAGKKKS